MRGRRRGSSLSFVLTQQSDFIGRLEEEIARMKKNQERRLHRKNAKIIKEGGTPMQLNRPVKPDTTVRLESVYSSTLADIMTEAMWPLWPNGSYECVPRIFA